MGRRFRTGASRRALLAGLLAAPVGGSLAFAQPAPVAGPEEIVVTALKREQRLQEVPASITAFTATQLEQQNITRPLDFIRATPNMTAVEANNAGDLRITIRGDAQTLNTDAPVAVVVDGVVLTGATGLNHDLLDVQQIEVLKGPQGALYGRNAISGAINIVTRPPSDHFEGKIIAGYGNGESAKVQFTASTPVIQDKLAIRVSGTFRDTEGFYRNITRGDYVDPYDEKAIRFRADLNITDDLSAELGVFASHIDAGATNYQSQSRLPSLQTAGPISGIVDTNFTDAPFVFNVKNFNHKDDDLVSLRLDYAKEWGRITSISAFESENDVFGSDGYPYLPTPDNGTQYNQRQNRSYSEELRFTSPTGERLRYIVGAYYVSIRQNPYLLAATGVDTNSIVLDRRPPITGPVNPTLTFSADNVYAEAWAFFANASYDILDNLQLTAAGRIDHEDKRAVDVAPAFYSSTAGQVRSASYERFQPRIDLSYKITPDANVYATYGIGFKAGGFNAAQTFQATGGLVPNSYPSERARNVEVGAKTQWLDRRLTLNGAAFYTKKDNSQLFQFIPAGSLNAVTVIDSIDIKGVELEAVAALTSQFTVRAGFGYTSATIDKLASNPSYVGKRAPYVPDITSVVDFNYTVPVFSDYNLVADLSWEHTGSVVWDTANSPYTRRDPLDILNGRLALEGSRWEVALWSKNINDLRYYSDVILILNQPALLTQAVHKAPPRTYGVDVTFKF